MSKFRVRCELTYEVETPVVFLLNVRAQDNQAQKVLKETFSITPETTHALLACGITQNRFDRITAEAPGTYRIVYEAVVESFMEKVRMKDLPETSHEDFDLEHLPFLYPSRYCQSDRLGRLAAAQFGSEETPVRKVQAISRWISGHVAYISGSSNVNTSSMDTLVDYAGVCRDFAHLGIALCRALNIPARYFTGYASELDPPDFHACFETWVGGRWLLWDATKLSSPDSVVRIGTGRDAADVSVCTSFGRLTLKQQAVSCEVLDTPLKKIHDKEMCDVVVCHDSKLEPKQPDNSHDP
ncbi:MAG: transglutaminase family protein [Prosthecobacter sp.]|nr:transglutaminase family protein [Prosthecobacter sp.]